MSKISKIIDIQIVGTKELQQLEQQILATETKLKNMTKAGRKNAGMQKIHAENIVNTKLQLKQLRSERNQEQKAILKSGKKKGEICGRINCKIHKNKKDGKVKEKPKCKVIIKTGKRKGEICNRFNCPYHKNKLITI